jgi:hypothetical protein
VAPLIRVSMSESAIGWTVLPRRSARSHTV